MKHTIHRLARPARFFALVPLWVCVLAGVVCFASVAAAQTAGGAQGAAAARLQKAVDQLQLEAENLDEFKEPKAQPVFTRPHPVIQGWGPEMGLAALQRMQRPFTGQPHRDTYIRWHLIWAIRSTMADALEQFKVTGEHHLPEGVGAQLVELVKKMPGEITEGYRPDWRDEPEEIGARWRQLREQSRVRVGFPPFEQDYWGAEALPHVSPEEQARLKPIIAEMERLRTQFRVVVDEEARAFNIRLDYINRYVREYRADLCYAITQTGDPAMLRLVINEIGNQVGKDQYVAFDLLRYIYLAAFDGYLTLYTPETLADVGGELQRIFRGEDRWKVYKFGDEPPPSWFHPQQRNFADYAFHMVEILSDPGVVQQFYHDFTPTGGPERTRVRSGKRFTPDNFTMADVQAARDRAIAELYEPSPSNEVLLPNYTIEGDPVYQLRHFSYHDERYQEIVHEAGNHAVIAWAMLAAGETYQDPRLFKRINWVLSSDAAYTYDRGMRLQMLAQLPYLRWGPWVKRDASWLSAAITSKGNFPYQFTGETENEWGDHANGQYGVLGLWGAQEAGLEVPLALWKGIDAHWRATQQKTPNGEPAGWAIGMFNVDAEDPADQLKRGTLYNKVSAPMTAGGVATLNLTERYLYGPKRTTPGEANLSPELAKGIAWLDEHFALQTDATMDWFYYMWTMQRVGQATGYRTFNGIDWFRQVTAEMLNRQGADGLWHDPQGKQGRLMSTGFALLYLANSYAPIAVSKVRFDGEWNNRPHDIWNFADYASDEYEVKTTWQIVELDQPVYQLIESPILYLATGKGFELSDAHVQRLREYIDAGGMLVTNPDTADAAVTTSIRKLAEQLFPGQSLEKVENDHLLYNVHRALRPVVQMQAIDNGIRPLMVHFVRDIGEGLQTNDVGRSESFVALNNLYLYAVGMNPRRERLDASYVVQQNQNAPVKVKAARIRHAGDFDPEPAALQQLKAVLANNHRVDLQLDTVEADKLSSAHKIAFLTTRGQAELTDQQAQAIRKWVEAGGTLWLDAAGGSQQATEGAYAMLKQIMPNAAPTPLGSNSPIISGDRLASGFDNRRVQFRFYALREMGPVSTPRLQTVRVGERPAIIFSPEDLTAGLAGLEHWGIFGYSVESARQLVINGVLDVANN